jgi:hypothetical protein
LIYGLSCVGFKGLLRFLKANPVYGRSLEEVKLQRSELSPIQQEELAALQTLSYLCGAKGMQVLLAPERYEVDVLGGGYDRDGY